MGNNFVYTVRVRNTRPSTATTAMEMAPLGAGLTLVSTTCGAKLLQSVGSLLAPGEQFGLRSNGNGNSGRG